MTTRNAFDRLDELMSRQPPNARIPKPSPLVAAMPPDNDYASVWDEMWGLWLPGGYAR